MNTILSARAYLGAAGFAMLLMASDGVSAGAAWYGALAYDYNTGAWGWATRDDPEDAADVAQENCEDNDKGDDCNVVWHFQNTCGAFALGSKNALGWGLSRDEAGAKQRALSECRKVAGDSSCQIKNWACTQRD